MQEEQNNQQPAEQAGNVISPSAASQPVQSTNSVATNAPETGQNPSAQQAPVTESNTLPQPPVTSTPAGQVKASENLIQNSAENIEGSNPAENAEKVPEPQDGQLQVEENNLENEEDLKTEEEVPTSNLQEISWIGSEYIHHEKSAGWFFALFGITAIATGAVFAITRDFITSGMIIFCALLFGIFSRRQPGQIQYSVSDNGIVVNNKEFAYSDFKSFMIAEEGALKYIMLKPAKRFDTLKTMYCSPEQVEQISEVIASHLPLDDHSPDVVDRLMQKVRF